MPTWLEPQQIMLIELRDLLTIDDLTQVAEQTLEMLPTKAQLSVHLIVDVEFLVSAPHNLIKIGQISRPLLTHKALGWMVVTGMKYPLQRFLTSTLAQLFNIRCHTTATVQEAADFLRSLNKISA